MNGLYHVEIPLLTWATGGSGVSINVDISQVESSNILFDGTQNNAVYYRVGPLQAGTWKLVGYCETDPTYGIATWLLDVGNVTPTTSVATTDFYSAGTTSNVVINETGITIASTGLYSFGIKMATKGSGSAYGALLSTLALIRTGA